MNRTLIKSAPVVTMLSPSPAASRRMLDSMKQWTGMDAIDVEITDDQLNKKFGFGSTNSFKWDSVAMHASNDKNGAILHWLSLADAKDNEVKCAPMQLLAIHGSANSVKEARAKLVEDLGSTSLGLVMKKFTGRPLSANQLLKKENGNNLPILDFSENPLNAVVEHKEWKHGDLKEIVIPTSDEDTTLFTLLSQSPGLSRVVAGVYQTNNQNSSRLCVRPLPIAKEDRNLPPPSFVFHAADLDKTCGGLPEDSIQFFKIGYTGGNGLTNCAKTSFGQGQVMLRGNSQSGVNIYGGLDIRLCSSAKPTSMFAEAQESMLASSVKELQSKHVEGSSYDKDDPNINRADCWVEFRATVKNPTGYFSSRKPRIAKAPDLPYE